MSTSERVSTKVKDFLKQDPPIRGQNYACISFISPEDVIIAKEVYFFSKYLDEFANEMHELFDNLIEKFKDTQDTKDMLMNLKSRYNLDAKYLQSDFTFFKASHSDQLENDYLKNNEYQTTMRGIKIRGVYDTLPEAEEKARHFERMDNFNVYVASVGCWCPWSPNPEEIDNCEYAETEVNTLVKNYRKNVQEQSEYHEKLVRFAKEQAEAKKRVQTLETDDRDESDTANTSVTDVDALNKSVIHDLFI